MVRVRIAESYVCPAPDDILDEHVELECVPRVGDEIHRHGDPGQTFDVARVTWYLNADGTSGGVIIEVRRR